MANEATTVVETRVAGVSYCQTYVHMCKVGNTVALVPEPENRFDQHALRVDVNPTGVGVIWLKVGYVPKKKAVDFKNMMREPNFKGAIVSSIVPPFAGSDLLGMRIKLLFGE